MNKTRLILPGFLGALLLLLLQPVSFAQFDSIEVRVLQESIVEGDTYNLGNIAELDGFDVDKIQKLAAIKMGVSPLPGRSHLLNKRKIEKQISNHLNDSRFKVIMPKKPIVSRASVKLQAKQLETILLAEIREKYKKYKEVKVEIKSRLKDQFIPKGKVSYQIKRIGNTGKIGGYSTWSISLETDQKEFKKVLVRAKIEVIEDVLVAKDKIKRGETIEMADLKKIKKDISKEKTDFLKKSELVVGQQAKRDILKNESLKTKLVQQPILIEKGSPIKVVYQTEKVYFSNLAIALRSGRRGETIPVRTISNNKTIFVRVIDRSNAEVAL